jgi:hypothetical protein
VASALNKRLLVAADDSKKAPAAAVQAASRKPDEDGKQPNKALQQRVQREVASRWVLVVSRHVSRWGGG